MTPDEYRVSKVTGEVLHRTIGAKHVEYVRPAARGTVRVDVPEERRDAPASTTSSSARCVELARRIERHFGCHQDVEWAIARERRAVRAPVAAGHGRAAEGADPRRASAMELVMGTFGRAARRT